MNAPKVVPTPQVVIGVDVSAAELVCASRPAQASLRRRYANSKGGVAALLGAVERMPGPVHVVCEATGHHHVRLQEALWEADVPCAVVQPRRLAHYAKVVAQRNKTDALDAALLADFGAKQHPPVSAPMPAPQRTLTQLGSARRAMVQTRTRRKNQLGALRRLPRPEATCLREFTRMLASVERSIARLDAERSRVTEEHFATEMALLSSITGIGTQTASALVGYCGDLSGFASPRKLVAFIGTNPRRDTSGTSLAVDRGITKQGNAHLRTLFYMGALTARKHNAACRALYERLIARGKTKKQALVAVASKLARQAWAVLHYREPYVDGLGLSP